MTEPAVPRLGLGTAQFGLAYGVSRGEAGALGAREVAAVLERAAELGVELLDTAPAYGASERRIGALRPRGARFRVVTKTEASPAGARGEARRAAVVEGLERSLERLRMPAVHGLLEHRPDALLGPDGPAVHAGLVEARERGLARRIGVSVHGPDQLEAVLERFPVDLVQVPFSIFDQRLAAGERPARLRARGIELHTRSTFLQGLLLMREDELPPRLGPLAAPLARFRRRARAHGLRPLQAALGFALAQPGVDAVLCGVHGRAQLEELVAAAGEPAPGAWCRELALHDPAWLEPARWPEAAA